MGLGNISIDTHTQLGEELRYSRDRRAVQLSTVEEQPTHATQRVALERCCNSCYAEQQLKAYNKNKQEHSASRSPYGPEPVCRNKMVQVVRSSNQAAPGAYKPPGTTIHQPYLNYGAGEPMSYYSHEGMSADIPKHSVLCLRWISGLCGQNRRSTQKEAEDGCPYAHPDLSEVPPGVCPTYWFTGFCRFNRKVDMQTEDAMEEETFGCHGWAHFTRVAFDVSISDSSSSDSDKDKKKSRRRPPSVCLSCHHVQREGGFPLLPGISCKMTVCEREAALALYSDYMNNNWRKVSTA